jgi:peptide/nickel transport system ATP-binding protein/oligopeptide transport system ATP-binding protein
LHPSPRLTQRERIKALSVVKAPPTTDHLLDVRGLKTYFKTYDGIVKAVDGVDFRVQPGKTLGIVGESGCGKSVTSLSVMRLIDRPGWIESGEIWFEGRDLLDLSEDEMRAVRGNKIAMIFQEPMTSLNPVYTVGNQVGEVLRLHKHFKGKEVRDRSIEMLRKVGIPEPARRMDAYPHNLSGGMRQRVMIAMALATDPKLLIADEPTTALDVTIQAQILDLMRGLSREFGTAVMLITHDLGVVAEMADEVTVMYTGGVVEHGTVYQVLKEAKHPYTQGLLNSIPSVGLKGKRLTVIKGAVPNPLNLPKGCTFAPRCPHVMDICLRQSPRLIDIGKNHQVHCWLYQTPGGNLFEQSRVPELVASNLVEPPAQASGALNVNDAPTLITEPSESLDTEERTGGDQDVN